MIHELFTDQFSRGDNTTQWKKTTFERVDHIISISHSTKRDLVELFDIDERKITVIHLGVDLTAFKKNRSVLPSFDRPFVLYVGGRDGYKNFTCFLNAFAGSVNLMNELDVIAFGGGRFNVVEKQLIKKLGFKDNQVRQVGGSDDVLATLYHRAVAFIYPSLYEGFGLPPLEAMASGCPVVSSNTSSIPEVVRESGVYFDPRNVAEMQSAIEKVVFSDSLKKDLISSGYKNIDHFSWQKCTCESLKLYRKLSGKL
jgi:glycosyltransferase involved in cell wall biosynthesis